MDFQGEVWARITEFPDYAVSNDGRVLSIRYNRVLRAYHGRVHLKRHRQSIPYLREHYHGIERQPWCKHGLNRGLKHAKSDPFFTIYALLDPRDLRPFYVGRTKCPIRRMAMHIAPKTWENMSRRYAAKMRELRAAMVYPIFKVLETTLDASREEWHILEMARFGYPLVNKHKTGVYITPGYGKPRNPNWRAERKAQRAAISKATAASLSFFKPPTAWVNPGLSS